jgi:hypothetical protein
MEKIITKIGTAVLVLALCFSAVGCNRERTIRQMESDFATHYPDVERPAYMF